MDAFKICDLINVKIIDKTKMNCKFNGKIDLDCAFISIMENVKCATELHSQQ